MKKMRISLFVVVAIIVLAGFSAAEVSLDTSRVVNSMKGLPGPPDVESRIQRAIVIGVVGGVVTLFVILLAKIAKQQKEMLENQRKASGDSLKKGKQPIHV